MSSAKVATISLPSPCFAFFPHLRRCKEIFLFKLTWSCNRAPLPPTPPHLVSLALLTCLIISFACLAALPVKIVLFATVLPNKEITKSGKYISLPRNIMSHSIIKCVAAMQQSPRHQCGCSHSVFSNLIPRYHFPSLQASFYSFVFIFLSKVACKNIEEKFI